MTLIELLIAMVVITIGIFAIVAGFASGILSIQRAATSTNAGTIADQQLEAATADQLCVADRRPADEHDDDGHRREDLPDRHDDQLVVPDRIALAEHNVDAVAGTDVHRRHPVSRPVKLVAIEVRNTNSTGKLLFSESSTFDQSMG